MDSSGSGEDSTEENYASAGEDLLSERRGIENSRSGVGAFVDSLKSTMNSAIGMVPDLYPLDTELDDDAKRALALDAELSDQDTQRKADANVKSTSHGREEVLLQFPSGENSPSEEGGREELVSPDQAISRLTREGWYVVDPSPEEVAREIPRLEATHVAYGGLEIGQEEFPKLALESHSLASRVPGEPEIQVDESPTPMSPSISSLDFADEPFLRYNGKPSLLLRRRTRSFSKATENYPHSSHFLSSEEKPIPCVSDKSLPGASRGTKGKDQLENEDSGVVSEVETGKPYGTNEEAELRSGYDPELEDDDNDASSTLSRDDDKGGHFLGRRSPLKGTPWEEGSSRNSSGRGRISEVGHAKEGYRMPESDDEVERENGELLSTPAGFIVQAIGFQLRLILHVVAISFWLFNGAISMIAHPIHSTVEVSETMADVSVGAINQGLGVISFVGEGFSKVGSTIRKLCQKTIWGCLGTAYLVFILGLLLFPTIFFNLVFVNRYVEEPIHIRKALDFDYTHPRAFALVPLFSPKEVERVKNLHPGKKVKTRVLPVGSKFHITAFLTLPESEYNRNLGMFQVSAELLSARNQVLLRASKPCRLPFRSFLVHFVKSLVYSVPFLMGFSKEVQKLEIRILEAREAATPTASIKIILEPKAHYRDGGGLPDLDGAEMRLESTLPFPKSILSKWKWTFFVWSGVCLYLFELSVILCCCRSVLFPFGSQHSAPQKIAQGVVRDQMPSKESSFSRRARSKRSHYFEDSKPGASAGIDEGNNGTNVNEVHEAFTEDTQEPVTEDTQEDVTEDNQDDVTDDNQEDVTEDNKEESDASSELRHTELRHTGWFTEGAS